MRVPRLLLAGLMLALSLGSGLMWAAPVVAAGECAPGEQYFPETKKCVIPIFYQYWLANGGMAQQGLPLTDDFNEISAADGKTYTVQYFERARFEYHPEHAGTPYEVLLGLLGNEQLDARYGTTMPSGVTDNPLGTECETFPATGKQVCGAFLQYWRANGGLAQQGLPKTDLFVETNPTDGKPYVTQYFERARFEYHPENLTTAPKFVVLLGLLGREQFQAKYPDNIPVLQDSFADPAHEPLETRDTPTEQTSYANGGYRVTLKGPELYHDVLYRPTNSSAAAALNTIGFRDQRVEVEFTHLAGGPETGVSVHCRAVDFDHFYALTIGPNDGYYSISVVDGAEVRSLAGGGDARNPLAQVGSAPTRLRADCVGDTLTLYVNGQKIAEVRDTTYSGDQAGFGLVSDTTAGMDVVFKNLKLAILPR